MHISRSACSAVLVASVWLTGLVATPVGEQRVNAHGAAVKAFRDRTEDYMKFHREVAGTVPALDETADAAKISAREKLLGEAIRKARAGAQPGTVFGQDLKPFFLTTLRKDWRQRPAQDRRGLLEDMPKGIKAEVNATYPTTVPLATFPPTLLRALPPLPEGLEYRFLGRHLILRDSNANLIVDVLPNALPA